MTVTNAGIAYADVRESIAVAKSHGEKFFEQIVWQVENEVWTILGYKSWDEMREVEYADMGVVAPRADRPELVQRLRSKGLTITETASTLGVSKSQVHRDVNSQMGNEPTEPIVNARGQQRPATYEKKSKPRKRPYEERARGQVLSLMTALDELEEIAGEQPGRADVLVAPLTNLIERAQNIINDIEED